MNKLILSKNVKWGFTVISTFFACCTFLGCVEYRKTKNSNIAIRDSSTKREKRFELSFLSRFSRIRQEYFYLPSFSYRWSVLWICCWCFRFEGASLISYSVLTGQLKINCKCESWYPLILSVYPPVIKGNKK